MHKKELIEYWLQSSDRDFQTMMHLLEKGDFTQKWTDIIKDFRKWLKEKLLKQL
ncbi:uncharacterized protein Dmul_33810 [Desulfococcus multivorans]|nr:uncharacterized protein Dmul_33810 [Desulfococcus multivorans]